MLSVERIDITNNYIEFPFYETTISDFMPEEVFGQGTIYTYVTENGKPYNAYTKRGYMRKDAKDYVIVGFSSVGSSIVDITVKKYSSISALEKFGFCVNHRGKMAGNCSYSTSVKLNPRCMARAKDPDSICAICFANQLLSDYAPLEAKVARNTAAITNRILELSELPILRPGLFNAFRLESFGDLNNEIQFVNYANMARINPGYKNVTIWTKNPDLIESAIEKYGITIPDNMNIIYSSPKVNAQVDAAAIKARYPFITAIFTVYSLEYAKAHNITINCGARDCTNCNLCYRPHDKNNVLIVNELRKEDQ